MADENASEEEDIPEKPRRQFRRRSREEPEDTRREYVLTAALIQGGEKKEAGSTVRLNARQAEQHKNILNNT